MSERNRDLGAFLRARRELVTPEQAGIHTGGTRRVPGLRREEVAMLAGISADYYLRLEQGRDRHPSAQVLEALGRVLLLDDEAIAHLFGLATQRPRVGERRRRPEQVPASTARLVNELPYPAFIEGKTLDVLAANTLAQALSPRLTVGHNRMRDLFLDRAEQDMFTDWEQAATQLIAGFRQALGSDTDNPRAVELVGELSLTSPTFRRLWDRHDVQARRGAAQVRLTHPMLGDLALDREKLAVSGTDEIMLVIYHASPGSTDSDKLALLMTDARTGAT